MTGLALEEYLLAPAGIRRGEPGRDGIQCGLGINPGVPKDPADDE